MYPLYKTAALYDLWAATLTPHSSLLIPNSSLLTVVCRANDKKSAHEEEVRYRLCNLVCRYTFLRCGFFVFLSENPPRKGTSYIFVQGRKSFSIFSTSGRELYFPARVWYSPLVTNCSFHDPVYFSGIPPQGLPLRYIQYTT